MENKDHEQSPPGDQEKTENEERMPGDGAEFLAEDSKENKPDIEQSESSMTLRSRPGAAGEKAEAEPVTDPPDPETGPPDAPREFKIPKRCVIAMAIAAGGTGVFALLIPVLLTVVGFGAAGVTAGSLAALWQSTMGGTVVSGGLFATLQSLGATGGLAAATSLTLTGAAGASAMAFCAAFDRLIGYGAGPC